MLVKQVSVGTHLAVDGELVVWQESIGFVKEKVSSDKLLEAPVFSLDEAIGSLALWGREGGHQGRAERREGEEGEVCSEEVRRA